MNPIQLAVSRIRKKAEELYNPVRQNIQRALPQPMASPVPPQRQPQRPNLSYQVNQAYGNVLRPLASAQRFMESNKRLQAPQFKPFGEKSIAGRVGNFTTNLGSQIATDMLNVPLSIGSDTGRVIGNKITGRDLPQYNSLKSPVFRGVYNIKGQNASPSQVIGNVGGIASDALTVATPKFMMNAASNAAKYGGKSLLKKALIKGTTEGAIAGGAYGGSLGLSEGRGSKVNDQLLKGAEGLLQGAVAGGAFGGLVGVGGYTVGRLNKAIHNAIQKVFPKAKPEEVSSIAKYMIRDEFGKFSKTGKPKVDFYTPMENGRKVDMEVWNAQKAEIRKQLGLPDRYDTGAIDFDAIVGGPKSNVVEPTTKVVNGKLKIKMKPVEVNNIGPLQDRMKSADSSPLQGTSNNNNVVGKQAVEVPGTKSVEQTTPQISSNKSIPPVSGLGKIGKQDDPVKKALAPVEFFNKLYTQAIDRFNPLSRVAKQGGRDEAMRKVLTQHYGAGGTATYHVDFELAPILKGADINDLKAYTIAKRDLELSGRGLKGSDADAANAELAKLGTKYGGDLSKLEASAQKLYEYQRNLVKTYLVDSGVVSQQSYDEMLKNNQSYIPFKRVMDEVDDFLGVVPKSKSVGSVGSQNVLYKIKGSDKQIIDPIESIIENTYKIVSLGKRNKVAKEIVNLKEVMPDVIQPFKGEIGKKPVISVFENGKVQKYLVPPDVAEAAKGLDEDSLNLITKIFSVPTQLFRASATMYNPEFQAPNVTRDLQSAFINAGLNPFKFASGLAHLIKKDDVYQEYLKSGARTSMIALDRPFLKKTAEQVAGKGKVIKTPKDILNVMQSLAEYSEQPTRIALFEDALKKGLKKGLSQENATARAANIAQESTVNFSRRGSKTKSVNAVIAFLNARAQGLDRLVRTAKNNPVGFTARMGLITQLPAVLLYLNNRNYETYNDDRVVPEYEKQNNFIIMLSDKPIDSLGGLQYLKIPKGDVGRFANPTEKFMAFLDGKDANALESLAQSILKLSPIESPADIIPTAIKPGIEDLANYNFFTQRDIVPNYKKDLPAPAQDTESTSPIYRAIGEEINRSPAKIQNLVEGYGTGIAKIGASVASNFVPDRFKSEKNEQGATINKTPVVRRFAGGEKRTEEEQKAIDEKVINSYKYKIQDVKGAMKREDVSYEEGQKKIKEYELEQEKVKQKSIQSGLFGTKSDYKVDKKKENVTSDDAPKNIQEKIDLAIKGIQVDPQNTVKALFTKERLRKITNDAVILERKNYLNNLDDKDTRIDHIVPLSLGGDNDPKNLQVLSKFQHAEKAKLETRLYNQLKDKKITKSQAQAEIAKWNKANPVVTLDQLPEKKADSIQQTRQDYKTATNTRAALKIYDDEKLSMAQKQVEWKKIGTNAADVEFMVIDSLPNANKAPLVYEILKERKGEISKINKFIDKGILTSNLATEMKELGLISEQHLKDLKKYIAIHKKGEKKVSGKVSSGKGRKKKLKIPKLKPIKFPKSTIKIKKVKLIKLKALNTKKKKVDKPFT